MNGSVAVWVGHPECVSQAITARRGVTAAVARQRLRLLPALEHLPGRPPAAGALDRLTGQGRLCCAAAAPTPEHDESPGRLTSTAWRTCHDSPTAYIRFMALVVSLLLAQAWLHSPQCSVFVT